MCDGTYDRLAEQTDSAWTPDGFEEAYLGVGHQFGSEPVAVYDLERCIAVLMECDMARVEAIEFFEYNVIGSCMERGRMPVYVDVEHYREPPSPDCEDDDPPANAGSVSSG